MGVIKWAKAKTNTNEITVGEAALQRYATERNGKMLVVVNDPEDNVSIGVMLAKDKITDGYKTHPRELAADVVSCVDGEVKRLSSLPMASFAVKQMLDRLTDRVPEDQYRQVVIAGVWADTRPLHDYLECDSMRMAEILVEDEGLKKFSDSEINEALSVALALGKYGKVKQIRIERPGSTFNTTLVDRMVGVQ